MLTGLLYPLAQLAGACFAGLGTMLSYGANDSMKATAEGTIAMPPIDKFLGINIILPEAIAIWL